VCNLFHLCSSIHLEQQTMIGLLEKLIQDTHHFIYLKILFSMVEPVVEFMYVDLYYAYLSKDVHTLNYSV